MAQWQLGGLTRWSPPGCQVPPCRLAYGRPLGEVLLGLSKRHSMGPIWGRVRMDATLLYGQLYSIDSIERKKKGETKNLAGHRSSHLHPSIMHFACCLSIHSFAAHGNRVPHQADPKEGEGTEGGRDAIMEFITTCQWIRQNRRRPELFCAVEQC